MSGAPELQQASPGEEDLDTIAEEPTAERAASQAQSPRAQAHETHPHSVRPQQASDEGEVRGSNGAQAMHDEVAAGADIAGQSQGVSAHEVQDMDLDSRVDEGTRGSRQHSFDTAEESLTGTALPFCMAAPHDPVTLHCTLRGECN